MQSNDLNNPVLRALKSYKNPASAEMLRESICSNDFKVLFEFDRLATNCYFKNLERIFNVKTMNYINSIHSLESNKVDAVFIMIPYFREQRLKAVNWAIRHNKPIYILEAGFVSSLFIMQLKDSPISFHVDFDSGIYLDSENPNTVMKFLNSSRELTEEERDISNNVIEILKRNMIFKYNHSIVEYRSNLNKKMILVIDQSYNDWSIVSANANQERFNEMVEAALQSNQGTCRVLIKVHPDVLSGKRKGNIDISKFMSHPRIEILQKDYSNGSIFDRVQVVYTVCSTLGFEALLRGCEVHTFGKCFYSGWGLTEDHYPANNRLRTRKLEDLVYSIYCYSTYYCDPITRRNTDAITALRSITKVISQYRLNPDLSLYLFNLLNDRLDLVEEKNKQVELTIDKLNNNMKSINTKNSDRRLQISSGSMRGMVYSIFKRWFQNA